MFYKFHFFKRWKLTQLSRVEYQNANKEVTTKSNDEWLYNEK